MLPLAEKDRLESLSRMHLQAMAAVETGEYETAIGLLEAAVAGEPDRATWLRDLATLYSAAGRWNDAATILARAHALEPDHVEGLRLYGRSLLEAAQAADALSVLYRAFELAPDD